MTWGEAYYDHYVKFLGDPIGGHSWHGEGQHTLQLLVFQPSAEIRAFCTLGLTHYPQELGGFKEVFVPVDAGWDEMPQILAYIVTGLVYERMNLVHGTFCNKIDRVALEFTATFGKTAMYFTEPLGLPSEFEIVHLSNEQHGTIHMGCFISAAEQEFMARHEPQEFENLMAEAEVDPTALKRSSVLN